MVFTSQKWKGRTAGPVFCSLGLVWLWSFSSHETGLLNTRCNRWAWENSTCLFLWTCLNHVLCLLCPGYYVRQVQCVFTLPDQAIHTWFHSTKLSFTHLANPLLFCIQVQPRSLFKRYLLRVALDFQVNKMKHDVIKTWTGFPFNTPTWKLDKDLCLMASPQRYLNRYTNIRGRDPKSLKILNKSWMVSIGCDSFKDQIAGLSECDHSQNVHMFSHSTCLI